MARKDNEAIAIRVLNALATTQAAPTLATDGIAVYRKADQRTRCHLEVRKTAASGDRDIAVQVWGYRSEWNSQAADEALTPVAMSAAWYPLDGALFSVVSTGDFNRVWLIQGAQDWDRLALEVPTNDGSTPALSAALAFAGAELP